MTKISIIPQPTQLTLQEGNFTLTADTIVLATGPAIAIATQFSQIVAPATGYSLVVNPSSIRSEEEVPVVEFRLDPELTNLGTEGYRLTVTPKRITAQALQSNGLFYALQTLRQLLPTEIFEQSRVSGVQWAIPCVEIEDQPRFGWRGAMLDVCRHFMPKPFVLKFIDLLALHKMNTFHWHLTEDQGWRIEILKYPKLTEIGAWRRETVVGHWSENRENPRFDGTPHGGFYTQKEVREVVDYARARFVNVVPEIEMPGHSQAAIAAYPELGNTGRQLEVSRGWGIHEDVFNVEEHTFQFLQDVLEEVMALFPSTFIHVGGDEVPKIQWKNNPAAQERMRQLGLKDEDELQSYFIRRIDAFLNSRGRRLVGWDEILEGGLAPGATVMSWRGEEGGIAAANAGHDVVMAPNEYTYLDYYQSENIEREPLAIGGFLPIEKVYSYDPLSPQIKPELAHHVLGVQAQLWTEYMPNPSHVEYMAFPRLCAVAEVGWTPPAQKDFAAFRVRLADHLQRLKRRGVNYRELDT